MSLSSNINNQLLYLVIQHDKQIKYILNNAFNGVNINLHNNNDRDDLLSVNVNSNNVNDYVYNAIKNNSTELIKINLNNDTLDNFVNRPVNLNIDNNNNNDNDNNENDIYQVNINSNVNAQQIINIEEDIDQLEAAMLTAKQKVEVVNREIDEAQEDIEAVEIIVADGLFFA